MRSIDHSNIEFLESNLHGGTNKISNTNEQTSTVLYNFNHQKWHFRYACIYIHAHVGECAYAYVCVSLSINFKVMGSQIIITT